MLWFWYLNRKWVYRSLTDFAPTKHFTRLLVWKWNEPVKGKRLYSIIWLGIVWFGLMHELGYGVLFIQTKLSLLHTSVATGGNSVLYKANPSSLKTRDIRSHSMHAHTQCPLVLRVDCVRVSFWVRAVGVPWAWLFAWPHPYFATSLRSEAHWKKMGC